MAKYLPWIGTGIITIGSFIYSVFPILSTTPRLIAAGILLIMLGIMLCLPIGQNGSALQRLVRKSNSQSITATGGSQVIAAGRDFKHHGDIDMRGQQ